MAEWLHHIYQEVVIVGHNLSFDLAFLHQKFNVGYPKRLWDTMIAEQLLTAGLDAFDHVNLKDTVYRYFGTELDKTQQTLFTLDSEITQEQIDYIRGDVENLIPMFDHQAFTLGEQAAHTVMEIERKALPPFAEMVRYGVGVNRERLNPLLDETEIKRDELKAYLQRKLTPYIRNKRIADYEAMVAARKEYQAASDAKEAWFEEYWHDLVDPGPDGWNPSMREAWDEKKWLDMKLHKEDQKPLGMRRYVKAKMSEWRKENPRPPVPKLDESLINLNSQQQMLIAMPAFGIQADNFQKKTLAGILLDLEGEQYEVLEKLLAYKKAQKLLDAFGTALIEKIGSDGRLHGNFKQIGTATGRPSCSKPNMLQMPKDGRFRSCFIPHSGNLFVVADYSQMELRIMAQLSGDKAMQQAFIDGLDLHSYTASLMFKKPMEETGDGTKERQIAKIINFGILYGMGPTKLRETLVAEGIRMTQQEAVNAVKLWRQTYAKAANLIKQWGQEAVTNGYTATPFGRRRFFDLDFTDEDGNYDKAQYFAVQREGANHPIQGTNADVTKMAMGMMWEILEGKGTIVLQVYDEIVVECPEHLAPWTLNVVESCMRVAAETVLTDIPAVVDPMISRSWSKNDKVRDT